jgi:hypothetical protein
MRSLVRFTLFSMTLVLAAAYMPGCVDSVLIAPADSDFLVVANPATVTIDEPGGYSEAQSVITAQIFDASNFPMEGVVITFTSSGGTLYLESLLQNPGRLPAPAPVTVETDVNGIATLYLTISLTDDSTVDVTARSGAVTSSATVTKLVTAGNLLPEAYISAIPTNRQQVNIPVNFSGLSSLDPDGDDISCYKWTIISSVPAEDQVVQGHIRASITERYDVEQTLSITLHVSDDPAYAAFCTECQGSPATCGASDANFSPYFDIIDPQYQIVCDLTAPLVFAGSDQIVTLSGATVDVILDGSNSRDDDSTSLDFDWDCGNGTMHQDTETATCTYSSAGTFTATLAVTNDCGMTASDPVRITVSAP